MVAEHIAYARTFLGVPYKWGGDNRLQGMDCGAFVSEVLRAAGLVGFNEDLNTTGLWAKFMKSPNVKPAPGAILFFGASERELRHVALCVSEIRMIEAGGGDSTVNTLMDAMKGMGAMVRERPVSLRKDLIKCVMPLWP